MNDRVTGNCVIEHRNASWSSSPVDCVWACRKAKFLDGRSDGQGHVVERLRWLCFCGRLYDTEEPSECLTSSSASLVVRFCDGQGHVVVERLQWHCFGGLFV